MNQALSVPVWLIVLGLCFVGTAAVGVLFWLGAIATEQDSRDSELDERQKRLDAAEGEQIARTIRQAWDVALPGFGDEVPS